MRLTLPGQRLHLLLAIGFLGLAVAAALLVGWRPSAETLAYLGLVLLFTALVGALILSHWRRGQLDWFEPGIFVGLVYLFTFGYGGLRYVADPALLHPFLQADRGWMPLALGYTILGVVAFWVGYYSSPGYALHRLTRKPQRALLQAGAVVRPLWGIGLYAIGSAARLFMLQAGWYSYIMVRDSYFSFLAAAQVLILVEWACLFALVLAWLDRYSHRGHSPRRLLAYVLLASEMSWGFFSGMKSHVLLPVLLVIIVHTYKKGRIPLRALGATFALLILLYPLNDVYRQLVRGGKIEIRSPADMVDSVPLIAEELLYSFDKPSLYLDAGYEATLARTALTQNYALLLKYLDATADYEYGENLLLLPALTFVPRFLWADKPMADKGYWFATQVWGQDPRVANSVAITYPGDLYLQYGMLSLLVGMLLTGILLRWLYEHYGRPRTHYAIFFYVFLFYQLVDPQNEAIFRLAGTVKLYLILLALSFLVFRPPRLSAALSPSPEPRPSPRDDWTPAGLSTP